MGIMSIENLSTNFIQRGKSYKAGMLLLIKHLSEQDWKLGTLFSARLEAITAKIAALNKQFESDLTGKSISFKTGQARLQRLLASYSLILDQHTILKPFQTLVDAERYSVYLKEAEFLETKADFSGDEKDSNRLALILSEEPVNDKELLLSECKNVKAAWFESLPAWEKKCIQEITKKLEEENQQEKIVHSIPSSLRHIPGLANASFHACKRGSKQVIAYFRHATQLPIGLLDKRSAEDEQLRLTCFNVASQIRLSLEKINTQSESEPLSEVVILTQSLVSPGKAADFKAKYISDSSDNDTQIYETKEKAVQLFQKALANPNKLIQDDKIKSLFFNKEELDQKKDSLCYKDFLEKWGLISQSNEVFEYGKQKFHKITLLSTNHPLNVLRHLGTYQPQVERNEKNTTLLLGAISRYLESVKSKNEKSAENNRQRWKEERLSHILKDLAEPELSFLQSKLIEELRFCEEARELSANRKKSIIEQVKALLSPDIKAFLDENTLQLVHALHSLLSIPSGQGVFAADERHKPQLRSSAEIIIVNCLKGAAWIACKSGKDRTGGASIAADAAAIYYDQYKQFPLYYDDNVHRERYLKLLKVLYDSGHQQTVAAKNAPSAAGLVKATCFFPGDLKLDVKRVQSETQLARLNKPKAVNSSKKETFDHRALKSDLQDIKNKTTNSSLGVNVTLADWRRNWESYFINGKQVKVLRKDKSFKDGEDLSAFIETHLLAQIKCQDLKEHYNALALYTFHHGGFPHAIQKVSIDLVNQYLNKKAIIGQPEMQINFSWSKKHQGIQIETIDTYKEKKDVETGECVQFQNGNYHCQTQSCLLLNLSEVKGKGYNLAVELQSANVDCIDAFKPLFFKKSNFLEAFIHYLQLLLAAIKRYLDKHIKTTPDLNERWRSGVNSQFFKKSTQTEEQPDELAQYRFS